MLGRGFHSQSPRAKRTRSLFNELSRSQQLALNVSACVGICRVCTDWTYWCWAQKYSQCTVRVTACLGTQLLCMQQGFIGTTKQHETTDTSASTTPSDRAERDPLPKARRNPKRSRKQELIWQESNNSVQRAASIKEDRVHSKTRKRLS